MPKRFYKHKLLLDENIPTRQHLPRLNSNFNIKHIAADYKLSGLSDPRVYERARTEKRLLVTYNIRDFQKMAEQSIDTGIIGISPNLSPDQIDKKLTALLAKTGEKKLLGKFTYISGESQI